MGAKGTLGEFEVPFTEVTEAVHTALMVVERYGGKIDVDTLAKELNLKKSGGGFRMKVADYKGYGLLETGEGRGGYKATELAQKIHLTKDTTLRNQRKGLAFLNYPLFKQIFSHFGDRVPDEEALSNVLGSITGQSPIEVAKVEPRILRFYTDAAQYLKGLPRDSSGDQQPQIASEASGPQGENAELSQMMVRVPKKPAGALEEIVMGDVRIYLKPSLRDIKIAKGLLDVFEKGLKDDSESSNPRD